MKVSTKSLSLVILLALVLFFVLATIDTIFLLALPISTLIGLLTNFLSLLPLLMFLVGWIWLFVYYQEEKLMAGLPLLLSVLSWIVMSSLYQPLVNAHLGFRLKFNLYQEFVDMAENGEVIVTREEGEDRETPIPYVRVPEEYALLTNRPEIVMYSEDELTIIIFPRDHSDRFAEAFIYQSAGISPYSRSPDGDPKNVVIGWYFCEPTFHWQWFECYRD